MKRSPSGIRSLVAAGAIIAAATTFSAPAAHAFDTSVDEGVTAVVDAEIVATDEDVTIAYGGTVQHVDPTRDDYVPLIAPRSATGVGGTSAFYITYAGTQWRIPTGMIGHTVNGSGLRITSESAKWAPSVTVPVQVCNYQWKFQNRYGDTIYSTVSSKVFSGCTLTIGLPAYTYETDRTVKTGALCARFYVNGTFRGEQCHSVYP